MAADADSGLAEWVRYLISGIIGGAIMLIGIMRAWGVIARKAEDALALGKSSHDKHATNDLRLNALERYQTGAQAEYKNLVDTADRLEGKVDRLLERLGG